MRYGTYTTIDCPIGEVNVIKQALDWLTVEFEAIGGEVRMIYNPHDFGEYPSFEIDYPYELECVDDDDYDTQATLDDWHDKADIIQENYHETFIENI